MTDLTGSGKTVSLTASVTYPKGIDIADFSKDGDPIDSPSIQLADSEMTLNGDLTHWGVSSKIPLTLNVVPNSQADIDLSVLAEANRLEKNKARAGDIISITVVSLNGSREVYSNGIITDAQVSNSINSSGKLKSKQYAFAFGNYKRS